MLQTLRRHATTALIAGLTSLAILGAAPVAAAAYDAMNAQKVDGVSAVPYGTSRLDRAGMLIATDLNGHLPNNIIVRAKNADKLDGLDSTAFQKRVSDTCAVGKAISAIDADGNVSCVAVHATSVLRFASTAPVTTSGSGYPNAWPLDLQFTQHAGETIVTMAGRVTLTAPDGCSNQYTILVIYLDGEQVLGRYLDWGAIGLGQTKTFDISGAAARIAPVADTARTLTATVEDGCDDHDYTYDNLKLDVVLVGG
jgi:hypothetical protein